MPKVNAVPKQPAARRSVWAGPEVDGITQSLLSRFLCCRERFRCLVVEGLKPADRFDHKREFGQLWHTCEEALAAGTDWKYHLQVYAFNLARRYPMDQGEVHKWYEVCKLQFPLYLDHWKKHPDVVSRQNLLKEQAFDVPYKLPSGRVVRLRGKWDSVDLIGKGNKAVVYLGETKTKGDIDEQQIKRQLTFDLQTMMYLVALQSDAVQLAPPFNKVSFPQKGGLVAGVRYNVIRRPLSGGKGTIVRGKATEGAKCPKCKGQGKWGDPNESRKECPGFKGFGHKFSGMTTPPSCDNCGLVMDYSCPKCNGTGRVNAKPAESEAAYYARLAKYISDEPDSYFMRWQVEVLPQDVARFRRECLDPILEQLCDWWEYIRSVASQPFVPTPGDPVVHWRHPFGCYNVLDEGGSSELDEFLMNGNETGLQRTENLFPELS